MFNTTNNSKTENVSNTKSLCYQILNSLTEIIFELTQENYDLSIKRTMDLFDLKNPFTFNYVICGLIYSAFKSRKGESDLHIKYLKEVQTKEEEITQNIPKLVETFGRYITQFKESESYYLLNKMIEQELIDINFLKNIRSYYFIHLLKTNPSDLSDYDPFSSTAINDYDKLSANNFELHKKLIKEGVNPNEIAKIIRNDEIEKLQEISSQANFDFNQKIKPSLYERCSFINKYNVSLIDYAAFFSSVKCFKYLLMNNAKVNNTGKYAVAGGNEEIIHLCEQNHSTFKDAYETAIQFHQNNIFKYVYEKIQVGSELNDEYYSEDIDYNYKFDFNVFNTLSIKNIKEKKVH